MSARKNLFQTKAKKSHLNPQVTKTEFSVNAKSIFNILNKQKQVVRLMRKAFVLGNVRCFLHKDVFETNHKWSLNLETTDSRDFLTFSLNQKETNKIEKRTSQNKHK